MRTLMSRLTVMSAMFCMVAIVMGGLATAHSRLHIVEHQLSGDVLLPDGGWVLACADFGAGCQGHVETNDAPANDFLAVHHHHHSSGDVSPGLAPKVTPSDNMLSLAMAGLRPGVSTQLENLSPSIIPQPPRA